MKKLKIALDCEASLKAFSQDFLEPPPPSTRKPTAVAEVAGGSFAALMSAYSWILQEIVHCLVMNGIGKGEGGPRMTRKVT